MKTLRLVSLTIAMLWTAVCGWASGMTSPTVAGQMKFTSPSQVVISATLPGQDVTVTVLHAGAIVAPSITTAAISSSGPISATAFYSAGVLLGSGGQVTGTLLTASSGTFTTPAGTSTSTRYKVTLWGDGGGAAGSNANSAGGGGGGAAKCIKWLSGIAANTALSYTVGQGGAPGGVAASGSNGGSTTLVAGGITYAAGGGVGGNFTNSTNGSTGGAGGVCSNADISFPGVAGCSVNNQACPNLAPSTAAGVTPPAGGAGGQSPDCYSIGAASTALDGLSVSPSAVLGNFGCGAPGRAKSAASNLAGFIQGRPGGILIEWLQ